MKRNIVLTLVASSVLLAATSQAAPKVAVDGDDQDGVLTPSTKFNLAELLKKKPKFDLKKRYKTQSGSEITGQQFLDLSNKLQAASEKAGCSLGSGKPCSLVHRSAKHAATDLDQAVKTADFKLSLKKAPAESKTAKDAKKPLGFSWSKEWGNRKTAAVYVGAEFGNGGGSESASCGGAAYAGLYVFNKKHDVIRLEGEVSSSGTSTTGSAAFYVLGDSVWSKTGTLTTTPLAFEKSFSVSTSYTYWGLITLSLAAKVTGNAYITAGLSGTAKSGEFTCALSVTPGVKATLTASAEVSILGYGPVSAAAVGVEANLVLADVSLPIVASVSAKNNNGKVSFTESITADIKMSYLKGSLDAYFKTNIPLDGEKIIDWDSDKFTFTILDWDGFSYNKNLFKETATQTL